MITRKDLAVEKNWLKELSNAISDPNRLLEQLQIDSTPYQKGFAARSLFALRVPESFVQRMEIGNPNDPLLRQVLPLEQEFTVADGYSTDPLEEQGNEIPGLLHKYRNRVLLILKGGCAINCRYCFRRHFPYQDNNGNKATWSKALEYIANHSEITEIILSGGDPLMAKDRELDWLFTEIEQIPHIKRIRIHSRLPVVIPNRITPELCERIAASPLQFVMVTHVNHANEINAEFSEAMQQLKQANVTLLNQSVLLKGVNDNANALIDLSEALFNSGILPYYLHVLDKVQGAAHFYVSDDEARILMAELIASVSGYLVPTLAREVGGRSSKTPLDLRLE
jgi:EF-P beta-lysylation protein EpmB